MYFTAGSRKLIATIFFTLIIISFSGNTTHAQFYDLEVRVGDTSAYPGEQNTVISVYMKNWVDTVVAFDLWLFLEHPEICEFQTNTVTIYDSSYWRCNSWTEDACMDSSDITDSVIIDPDYPYDMMHVNIYDVQLGNHDISGTLIENWEFVETRSYGTPYNLRISAKADLPEPPFTPGIPPPQTGEIPLIKILADVYDMPDTTTDRDVIVFIQAENLDYFCFARPTGECIGQNEYDTIVDTSWYNCLFWNEDSTVCLFWEQVPNGPADSFWCCDTGIIYNPDLVNIENGTLTVFDGPCGDGDTNGDGAVNILDIICIVRLLYLPPYPSCDMLRMDVNCSGTVNLLDITYLISYLYKGGPPPCCL